MKFVAATGNAGKLAEIARITASLGQEVVSLSSLGLSAEVEETGSTFAENALLKARAACLESGLAAIADDSGLCVDALAGAPGVYTARYAGPHGDDDANMTKLLRELQGVPQEKRTARFVSAVALVFPSGEEQVFLGECPGYIGTERRGAGGFGYDPVFYVNGKSYAEMTDCEKDGLSHRAAALEKLGRWLADNPR